MKISTKEFYEKLNGKKLSEQEVFEAKQNFVGFFDLLYYIDRRNEEKKKLFNENEESSDLSRTS